jgi:hypothetical protein
MKYVLLFIAAISSFFYSCAEVAFLKLTNYMSSRGLILYASSFPNGTIFSIGTAYGSDKTVSAITNANPAVASSTSHGFTDGDIIVVSSGWTVLNGAVVRVDASDTNTFALEGVDASSTTVFPTGAGVGTVREVTTFVSLSQVKNIVPSGGEQQFYQWQYLEERTQRQRPTVKNARALTITLDYDPDLPWHQALITADQLGTPHAIKALLPNNDIILFSMFVAYDGEPSFQLNVNQEVTLALSYDNPRSRRYDAA